MSWGETIFLKRCIDGSKGLVASDNFYAAIPGTITGSRNNPTTVYDWFRMKWSGSFILKMWIDSQHEGGTVYIYKNNELVGTIATDNYNVSKIYDFFLTVEKGDIIGFGVGRSTSSYPSTTTTLSNIQLYADITDLSAFEVNYRS